MSTGHQGHSPNLDSVTTISKDGSHVKLHPSDAKGPFTFWRRVVGYAILATFVALPWITINGSPAVFLDTANRMFYFFGVLIAVQDLWILFFLISGLGFTLFFVTSLLGRIWCGWTCPYTLFLDHIYRRIERLVEGDAPQRRKLDRAPMSAQKITKRVIKHGLFILCSALIAHVFISYFVSVSELYKFIQTKPSEHSLSFGVIVFLTLTLYFCFAWFREQFCIVMCPYGRIQSALSDDDTVVIGYDPIRGEPRGKAKNKNVGDCVDCSRCVQVCPTGIDIRDGLQMECIGCAACIDACDDIMIKLKRPKGLIRYDSHNGLHNIKKKILRPRIFAYFFLMLLGAAALTFTSYKKARSFSAQVNKMAGMTYQKDSTGVRNVYQISLFNKRNAEVTFDINIKDAPEWITTTGTTTGIVLKPREERTYTITLVAPAENYEGKFNFNLQVQSRADDTTINSTLSFSGPSARLYHKALKEEKEAAKKTTP